MSNKQYIAIIGLDADKKPRAAKFDLADADAVRKAAQLMELRTATAKSDEQKALIAKLSDGKLFASGKGLVPLIKTPLYDLLTQKLDLEPPTKIEPSKQGAAAPAKQSLPQAWLDLKVGSSVLAPDPTDATEFGWWPGVIVGISGDKIVLRWIDAPKMKPHTVLRSAVAIMPPAQAK